MKAMKLAPIAMFLTLILGALPAAADHRGHGRANAGLERLAHELELATAELRDEVATIHRGWRAHRRTALLSLNRLRHDARVFHRRVERDGAADRATRRAFRELEASFAAASERIPAVRHRRSIRRDFAQIAALMQRLETRMARIDHRHGGRRHAGDEHTGHWRIAWSSGH